MSKVSRFFTFAFAQIIIVIVIIIAIISSLFYFKLLNIPTNLFTVKSSGTIEAKSELQNYSLEIKDPNTLLKVLNEWKVFSPQTTSTHETINPVKKIVITLKNDVNKISPVSKIGSSINGEKKDDVLYINLSLTKEALNNPKQANMLITVNFFNYILDYLSSVSPLQNEKRTQMLTNAQKTVSDGGIYVQRK